jgi:hypothetical protein
MKLTPFTARENKKGSILLSLAVHAVAIVLIASITFRYPISSLFSPRESLPTERIQYVKVQAAAPRVAAGSGTNAREKPRKAAAPAPIFAPSVTPSALPPIPPVTAPGSVNGTGNGNGGAPGGIASGIEPALPDPRIELRPNTLRMPLTVAQRNDSAVKAIFEAYREAEVEAEAHRGRDPRDWTFEKGGHKYGMDSSYIYLGKFKLPSAILAALPLNFGGVNGTRIIEGRNAAWIQNDIYTHSQGLSEDDFRAAIKRIRERTDREHKEAEDAKNKTTPIVP